MKKIILVVLILSLSHVGFAQYKGQFRAQYSGEFALKKGLFGNNFTAEYFPLEMLSFAPSFTIFTPPSGKASGIDLNFRYYLKEGNVEYYGLVGYAHFRRREELHPMDLDTFDSVNIGFGGLFKLVEELGLNPEIRYQPQNENEFLIKLGFVYFIN